MELKVKSRTLFALNQTDIRKMDRKIKQKIHKAIIEQVTEIEGEIGRTLITKQSKGRVYRSRKNPNQTHIASAPGYPPNEDTGDLRRGFWKRPKKSPLSVMFGIDTENNTGKDYAMDLEYGEPSRNLLPRPFFFSTILKYLKGQKFRKTFKQIQFLIKNEIDGQILKKNLRG